MILGAKSANLCNIAHSRKASNQFDSEQNCTSSISLSWTVPLTKALTLRNQRYIKNLRRPLQSVS